MNSRRKPYNKRVPIKKRIHNPPKPPNKKRQNNRLQYIQGPGSPVIKTPLSKTISLKVDKTNGSELDHAVMKQVIETVPPESRMTALKTLENMHNTQPSLWSRVKHFLASNVAPVAAGILIGAIVSGYSRRNKPKSPTKPKTPSPTKIQYVYITKPKTPNSRDIRYQQYTQQRFKYNAQRSQGLSDIFRGLTGNTPNARSQGLFSDILNYISFRTPGGRPVLSPLRGKPYYLE